MTSLCQKPFSWRLVAATLLCVGQAIYSTGCGSSKSIAGKVDIDGSSTVFPVTEAIAEEFRNQVSGDVNVTVGISGTGGGFKKFVRGEIDIADASRPILNK